jgi:hypothetical protein
LKNQKKSKIIKWRTFPGRVYAEMIAEALKNNKIYCIIQGEDTGILGGNAAGSSSPGKISIWIDENNVDRAEKIAIDMLDHI